MKVGVFAPFAAVNADPEFLRAVGQSVEERGFESVWVAEHVVLFDDYDSRYPYSPDGRFPGGGDSGLLEPFTALTFLAGVTGSVRLGTGICLVPQRNPVYTAKQVADLDVLSGGRVDFGVGIGWLREEFEVLQMPFEQRALSRARRRDEGALV
jgi:alkanesulfonate monooxygenase SsuD/methylene tetrahydromethanopterin reductase-like flavin-dependent oxidoreductase (luciferase family)